MVADLAFRGMYADMDTASSLVKHSNGAIGLVKEGETLASHLCREAERTGYSFCVVNLLSPIYTPYSAGSDLLKPPTFIEQNHVTIHEQGSVDSSTLEISV